MTNRHRNARFQIKSMEEGDESPVCTIEGLAGVFHNLDGWGDILASGACSQDIEFMCVEGKVRDEHGVTTGRITAAAETDAGLQIKGEIYSTAAGRDQRILLRTKTITRLSIGYVALRREWLETKEAVQAYWTKNGYTPDEDDLINLGYYGGARLLTRVRVPEVSTTWYPANPKAQITGVKGGPQAGHSFDGHTATVLAQVAEFKDRCESVAKIRGEQGRSLSPERKAAILQMSRQLGEIAQALETKGEPPTVLPPDALNAYARFLELTSLTA